MSAARRILQAGIFLAACFFSLNFRLAAQDTENLKKEIEELREQNRLLQEQLLTLEQQKFQLGVSTINDVIDVQRALAGARDAEVAALGGFSRARVALDLALGATLETNHVTVAGALEGIAPRPSTNEVHH